LWCCGWVCGYVGPQLPLVQPKLITPLSCHHCPRYLYDNWNKFDFVVAVVSVIGLFIQTGVGVNVVRVFRIARVFRLIKRAKVCDFACLPCQSTVFLKHVCVVWPPEPPCPLLCAAVPADAVQLPHAVPALPMEHRIPAVRRRLHLCGAGYVGRPASGRRVCAAARDAAVRRARLQGRGDGHGNCLAWGCCSHPLY
jgi:hypothetical protein